MAVVVLPTPPFWFATAMTRPNVGPPWPRNLSYEAQDMQIVSRGTKLFSNFLRQRQTVLLGFARLITTLRVWSEKNVTYLPLHHRRTLLGSRVKRSITSERGQECFTWNITDLLLSHVLIDPRSAGQ